LKPQSNHKHLPENYIHHQPSSLFLVQKVKEKCELNDQIFDIGCSSGRVLNSLYKIGFNNLGGCDINEVRDAMKENFPDLYEYFLKNSSRLVDGKKGDMKGIDRIIGSMSVDYFISHGRTFDVILQYHGLDCYLFVLDNIFKNCKKGVIIVQNQWSSIYLDYANKYCFSGCELSIGEHLYALYKEKRQFHCISEEKDKKSLDHNLFYGCFLK